MTTRLEALLALLDQATPGPWKLGNRPAHGHACWVYDKTNDIICTVANKPTRGMEECDANSNLIAAAPQALRDLIPVLKAALKVRPPAHTAHFDRTGGSGTGCPACQEEREVYWALRQALQRFESGAEGGTGKGGKHE